MDSNDDGVRRGRTRTRSKMDTDNPNENTFSGLTPKKTSAYGEVQGHTVGTIYKNRIDLKPVHQPATTWIHIGPEGPYSILLQGNRRFQDEGNIIAINSNFILHSQEKKMMGTNEEDLEKTMNWRQRILKSFVNSLKSKLVIRVVRVVKEKQRSQFRYDGLYTARKKMLVFGRVHFVLKREKNQPPMVPFTVLKPDADCSLMKILIRRKNALRKVRAGQRRKEVKVKNEPEFKQEVSTNFDPNYVESTCQTSYNEWIEFKEETFSIQETLYNDENQQDQNYSFCDNTNYNSYEEIEESTEINYEESTNVQIYGEGDSAFFSPWTTNHLNQITPTEVKPVYVELLQNEAADNKTTDSNLRDPLELIDLTNSDDNENSKDNNIIKMEDKKFFPKTCSYNDSRNYKKNSCFYSLTLSEIINSLQNNTNDDFVCPCKVKCSATHQFESNLWNLHEFLMDQKIDIKAIKEIKESGSSLVNIDQKAFQMNCFYNCLLKLFEYKACEGAMRLRNSPFISNRKIVKQKKKYVKKFVSVESAVASEEKDNVLPLPFSSPVPLREEEASVEQQLLSGNSVAIDSDIIEASIPVKNRRKKSKGIEATCLGPIIPDSDHSPRSRRGRVQNRPTRSQFSRCSARLRYIEEKEDDFRGFTGPFRPPSKLRLIQALLKKLEKITKGKIKTINPPTELPHIGL